MQYVEFHETKTAAQREADRKADAQWAKDHAPVSVQDDTPAVMYRPAVQFDTIPSAH